MSDGIITESFTFECHTHDWTLASKTIRKLRQLLRDKGGTSRLTKKQRKVCLTMTGPPSAVLPIARGLALMDARMRKGQEDLRELLRSRPGFDGEALKDDGFCDFFVDAILGEPVK